MTETRQAIAVFDAGDGLVLFGSDSALQIFDAEAGTQSRPISRKDLARASGHAGAGVSKLMEHGGRWDKLTAESASDAKAPHPRRQPHPDGRVQHLCRPEALDIVLASGVPVRMIGLNLTHQALATPEVVERMAAMQHVIGQTCAAWMGFFGGSYKKVWEFDAPPVHDPCTIAALIDPDVIEWREAFLAVELDGTWTRGTTIADLYGRYPDRAPNAQIAITLDAQRYWDLVLAAVDILGLPADSDAGAATPAEARP